MMGVEGQQLRKTVEEKRIPPDRCYQIPKPKHEMQLYASKYKDIVEHNRKLDLGTLDFTGLTVSDF